jgi:hypothetical protein
MPLAPRSSAATDFALRAEGLGEAAFAVATDRFRVVLVCVINSRPCASHEKESHGRSGGPDTEKGAAETALYHIPVHEFITTDLFIARLCMTSTSRTAAAISFTTPILRPTT